MENGLLKSGRDTEKIVSEYLKVDTGISNYRILNTKDESGKFLLKEVGARVKNEDFSTAISMSDSIEFYFDFENLSDAIHHITIKIKGENGEYCLSTSTFHQTNLHWKGNNIITMQFPEYLFNQGAFFVDVLVVKNEREVIISETDAFSFNVLPTPRPIGSWMGKSEGYFKGRFSCKNINL
ncbi:MAG: Wzt carbohydrate-binding domain-containing protein [Chitinophagales bacterium]|nr:Wzt carbohydrate-binding domain-containing protein [Chitinophagales bacterium]